MYSEI